MKKQEIIKKWTDIKDMMNSKEYQSAASAFLKDLKQLDEPTVPEVVVPRWFAEWIDRYYLTSKGYCVYQLWFSYGNKNFTDEEAKWLNGHKELATRAILDGFTVEKEQLYEVDFGFDNILYKSGSSYLIDLRENADGYLRFRFTKSEAEAINPKYLEFLVPVEED